MSLPFTTEELFAVFAAYNRTLWPFALALWVLAAAGAVALARSRDASRFLGIVLTVQWVWAGLAPSTLAIARQYGRARRSDGTGCSAS